MKPEEEIDGCDADMFADPLPDKEAELFALYAETQELNPTKTVEQVEAEWETIFSAPQ